MIFASFMNFIKSIVFEIKKLQEKTKSKNLAISEK